MSQETNKLGRGLSSLFSNKESLASESKNYKIINTYFKSSNFLKNFLSITRAN